MDEVVDASIFLLENGGRERRQPRGRRRMAAALRRGPPRPDRGQRRARGRSGTWASRSRERLLGRRSSPARSSTARRARRGARGRRRVAARRRLASALVDADVCLTSLTDDEAVARRRAAATTGSSRTRGQGTLLDRHERRSRSPRRGASRRPPPRAASTTCGPRSAATPTAVRSGTRRDLRLGPTGRRSSAAPAAAAARSRRPCATSARASGRACSSSCCRS